MKNAIKLVGLKLALLGSLAAFSVGCGGSARTEAEWQDDTSKFMTNQSGAVKNCYENALQNNPDIKGRLVVKFTFQNDTGRIKKVKFDEGSSTIADKGMRRCIEKHLEKLSMEPGDKNDGKATVVFDFSATVTDAAADPS